LAKLAAEAEGEEEAPTAEAEAPEPEPEALATPEPAAEEDEAQRAYLAQLAAAAEQAEAPEPESIAEAELESEPEPETPAEAEPAALPEPQPALPPPAPVVPAASLPPLAAAASSEINLNDCDAEQLAASTGAPRALARAIVRYRQLHGPFHHLSELLNVPGVTPVVFALLTGQEIEGDPAFMSLQELLGFPAEKDVTLKDVTDRISAWPDVIGCVLGQASGLPLVGSVPDGLELQAIVAFAPKLFAGLNASFKEFAGEETDEIVVPSPHVSYHIFRKGDLYLVILSSQRQMPKRHMEVARHVLSSIDAKSHR
jgi:DNA uptake protein ComE-like DNA-binding protein/predicted regulator of Ras-like GTPase activity (Roadblock/LC7/MglB family)